MTRLAEELHRKLLTFSTPPRSPPFATSVRVISCQSSCYCDANYFLRPLSDQLSARYAFGVFWSHLSTSEMLWFPSNRWWISLVLAESSHSYVQSNRGVILVPRISFLFGIFSFNDSFFFYIEALRLNFIPPTDSFHHRRHPSPSWISFWLIKKNIYTISKYEIYQIV